MTENMHSDLRSTFKSIKRSPPKNLPETITYTIELRIEREITIKKWAYGTVTVVSLVAIIPATIALGHQLSQSGFYQYASLGFSDIGAISGAWKDFASALAESLPGMSIALVLGLLAILVWSIRKTAAQTFGHSFTQSLKRTRGALIIN